MKTHRLSLHVAVNNCMALPNLEIGDSRSSKIYVRPLSGLITIVVMTLFAMLAHIVAAD